MLDVSVLDATFECTNILLWAFVRCCSYRFCLFYCKMSVVIIFACFVCAFCTMLTYQSCRISCLFECLLFCFFALYNQLLACLIFCNPFVHCLFDFCAKTLTFHLFCLLQVFLDVTCWFSAIFLDRFCFLLWSGFSICIILVTTTWFVVFVNFFIDFVAPVSTCFFYAKFGVLHRFIFARFVFYMYFLRLCTLAVLIRSHASPLQALPAQNYAYYPLCSFFWQTQS